MSSVTEFIDEQVESGQYEFAAGSPQAVLSTRAGGGGSPRPAEPPAQSIEDHRLIADTDPLVGEAIDTLVDYIVAGGYHVKPANITGTDEIQEDEDIADLRRLVELSTFESELRSWVWHALVDGTGFLELVIEDDYFKPKVLPSEEMQIQTNDFGNIEQFIQDPQSGDEVTFEPHEVAILKFHEHPKDDFGHSLVERVQEQADMLRDMEIDMARFVATKAYPPILWQCGTEERPWTQQQIDDWLDEIDDIEPESMLAVGHDVDHDAVGVTSTSSTSGAMKLEPTFEHLMTRIATGLGVPGDLLNINTLSGNELQVAMPKFDRRVQRYRNTIEEVVRFQVFPSILADAVAAEHGDLLPEFEFGEHSSEENRLEIDKAIELLNSGLLTPEAAAKRVGIDAQVELPDIWSENVVETLLLLSGRGDEIQNPDGGRPSDTGTGVQSSGREATTRQDPGGDNSSPEDRPSQSAEAQ